MAISKVEFPTHQRPTTNVNTGALLGIAVVITGVLYVILYMLPNNFVRDLFVGNRGPDELAKGMGNYYVDRLVFCGLITYLWALSTTNCILKMMRIRKERTMLDADVLPQNIDFMNAEAIRQVYDRVRSHPALEESIGLTRACRVLSVWINSEDTDRTVEVAKEEADLDAYTSDSSYRLNRLFIWALPVLGFIGTVYGVSLAVSNFAGFLQGAVTPEAIKVQVGLITTGLGVAFYTTLLGLIFATIAAFSSLLMERTEEGMLDEINELVEDRIMLQLPTAAETAKDKFPTEEIVGAIKESLAGFAQSQRFPVEELAQAIDAGFRRLPNPERYEEVFTKAITKAGDLINQKYAEFQTNYERRVAELGSELGSKLAEVGNNFNNGTTRMMTEFSKAQEKTMEGFAKNDAKLTERFDDMSERITTMGKEIAEQIGEAHERYVDAVEELDKKEIQRWEKMVNEFNQLAVKIADSFRQSVATLDSASSRYADRIQQSVQQLNDQLENITKLGNEIDKVLRTTQSMEATLRQVGSSDEFRQTLANIRSHLVTSDELLKQLSKPRKVVFQEARADEGL
jgi:biopolymer transport protein ExbB/TolQ/DNA-binding ferritin-like protein